MKVVGNCTRCGNPIYGQRVLAENEQPTIKRSCACVIVTMAAPLRAPSVWQQPFRYGTVSTGPPFQQAFNAATTTYTVISPTDEPDSDAGMVT